MLIWKPVVGYEGWYEVSNMGRIRSLDRTIVDKNGLVKHLSGKILKPNKQVHGYLGVYLCKEKKRPFLIHRVVAEAFIGSPKSGQQVNHKDLNKENNRVSNLEWVSRSENARHAEENITHRNSKLNREKVLKIRRLIKFGTKIPKIASLFGVSTSSIDKVRYRITWSWV